MRFTACLSLFVASAVATFSIQPPWAEAAIATIVPPPASHATIDVTTQSCTQIDTREVGRLLQQRAAMRARSAQPVPVEALNESKDREAYHRWLVSTRPPVTLGITSHPMTTAEFIDFQATDLIDRQHYSLGRVVASCKAYVATMQRGAFGRVTDANICPNPNLVRSGGHVIPACSSGPEPCPPTYQRTGYTNGTSNTAQWNAACAYKTPTAATGNTNAGAVFTSNTNLPVTITGETGTNGPIPGVQINLPMTNGSTVSYEMPSQRYIARSGWYTTPTASTFNGKPASLYLNPSQGSVTAIFDNNNWGEVYTSNGGYTLYSDVNATPASATFALSDVSGAQLTGDTLLYLGAVAGAYAAIPTPFSWLFGGLAAGFALAGAGIIIGNDLGLFGTAGGGDGGSDPVTDDDVW